MPGWSTALGAVAVATLAAGLAGLWGGMRYVEAQHTAKQTTTALTRSEAARDDERLANKAQARIIDAHHHRLQANQRAAAGSLERLRQLSADERAADPTLSECGRDAPATAVLRDEDRSDLVALAQEADDVIAALIEHQERERAVKGCQ